MSPPSNTYNLATDCIDKHAESWLNKNKVALSFFQENPNAPQKLLKTELTYTSLKALTNRMANVFVELKIQAQERVLLRLPNSTEFPISFLGAVKAQIIPIPTSPLFQWDELKFLLQDSEATALITTPELCPKEIWEQAPKSLKHILLVAPKDHKLPAGSLRWQEVLKEASSQFKTQATPANSPAYWLYTSGTTGQPKAVIHSHQSIRAHDARAQAWQDVHESDVVWNTSDLNWSYALTAGMLDIWRHGLTSVIYQGSLYPEAIAQVLRQGSVSTFMSVPGIYRRLNPYLKENPQTFRNVRVCLSAGEALGNKTREEFRAATDLEIYEGLGMTEHSVYLLQAYGEKIVAGSVGRPLPEQDIIILKEEDLTPAAVGEVGILASHQSCQGLMLGYWKHDEIEKKLFHQKYFLSGDLASQDAAGNYFFLGRRDDVITAGGYRVSPSEVEQVLNQHESVLQSAIFANSLENDKNIIEAHIIVRKKNFSEKKLSQELIEYAKQHLAIYKLPRYIHFVQEIPQTATGKIKRQSLTIA